MKKNIILILILILSINLFGCMYNPTATATFDSSDIKDESNNNNKKYKYKYNENYFTENLLTEYQTGYRYSVVRCIRDNDKFYKALCTYLNNFGGEIIYGYIGKNTNQFEIDKDTIIVKLPYGAPYIENLQEMLETYLNK